jgi:hypothetical protein
MGMANKPVFGTAICPYCKGKNAVFWNGNCRIPCLYCYKDFKIKRQKLKNVRHLKVYPRSVRGNYGFPPMGED